MKFLQPDKFEFKLNIRDVEEQTLENAPDGWEKTTIEFGRSASYSGLMRTLTTPFTFIKSGAFYLRREFYSYGLIANVKLIINKLNPAKWAFENIYEGKVDFSKFSDTEDAVDITSIEDDFSDQIKNNEDVEYQIAVDVPDALTVTLNPIPQKERADFIFRPNTDIRSDAFFVLDLVNNEQHATEGSVKSVGFLADNSPAWNSLDTWFYRATTDTTVRVQGHIEGLVQSPITTSNFEINLYNNNGIKLKTIWAGSSTTAPTLFNFDFDFTVGVGNTQRLFWYFENLTNTNTNIGFRVDKGDFNLNYLTSSPATEIKALKAGYVFNELIQLMNGKGADGTYTPIPTQSYLLNEALKPLVITCSNSIRKIENGTQYSPGNTLSYGSTYQVVNGSIIYNTTVYNPGQKFKAVVGAQSFTSANDGSVILVSFAEYINTSFKDFFQTIKSIQGGDCSFGIEKGVACLETLSYVYRPVETLNIGKDRRGVNITPALDLLFNSISIGYRDQQYDSLNGYQEVNSEQTYRVTGIPVNKQLDLISPYRADPYGIEALRVTPIDTAASRSDNDIFLLWLNGDMSAPLTTLNITGVDAGSSYYNWMLSPKHNLLRGGAYLASIFDKLKGYQIIFTSAAKNFGMVVTEGQRVAESDNIDISSLPSPIFKPYYIDCSTDLEEGALNNIDIKPFGYVSFNYRNTQLKGYIQNISVDAGQNSTRDYKLLMTPDNDLVKLIR